MQDLPQLVAALAFFGVVFVIPVIYMMLKHQRTMAEIIHRSANQGGEDRIRALELEVRELQAGQHRQIIEEDRSIVTQTHRT